MLRPYFQQAAANAVPSALTGLAGAATFGFIGSGGSPQGVSAGVMGSFGGGVKGAVSGAMLGAGIGAGLVGIASAVPAWRPAIGSFLASAARSGAGQRIGGKMAIGPSGGIIRKYLKGMKAMPHESAAAFMIEMLASKERKYLAMGGGAIGGAMGGLAGIPMGMARQAYIAGQRTTGPSNYGA